MPSEFITLPSASQSDDATDDHALMVRISTGDHHAFRTLVERHQHAVVGTVAKMLGNAAEAEDIAQQVFLRVWKNARRYKPDAKFTTYLFTITRNLVFNETRRLGRRREISADALEEKTHLTLPDRNDSQPDSDLLQNELQQAVDHAISQLPEAQRMAVILRRYEQASYEEIAAILATTVPSVKSLLFRARTTLRDSLRNYLDA